MFLFVFYKKLATIALSTVLWHSTGRMATNLEIYQQSSDLKERFWKSYNNVKCDKKHFPNEAFFEAIPDTDFP